MASSCLTQTQGGLWKGTAGSISALWWAKAWSPNPILLPAGPPTSPLPRFLANQHLIGTPYSPTSMSLVDKKRKASKAPSKASTGLGTLRKTSSNRTPRNDDAFLASENGGAGVSPVNHLTSFHPTSSSLVVNIDQSAELEKLSSKLFGIPLLAGTNFGLRIHPGSDCHVPLVVKDTIDWLAHYGTSN